MHLPLQTFLFLTIFCYLSSAKTCVDKTVSVALSARQGVFNVAIPHNNSQVVDFILNVTQQGRNFTEVALAGYQTTSKTYNISTRFCKPSTDLSTDPSVQILTHGIGFDKSYWDLPFGNDNSHSYIDLATDTYNYYTLSYDRLGLGASSHGDPLNEIQSFIEVAALQALSSLLRTGAYPGIDHAFSKIAHVGHSFGSILSYTFADQYPELSDALVLTGFTLDTAYVGFFAAGAHFVLANQDQGGENGHGLPDGYLVASDTEAIKYLHLKPGFYPEPILELAGRTKQPVTLGEILTLLSLPTMNRFTGPVMAISGDSDLVFCGSNCTATAGFDPTLPSIPAAVKNSFPGVEACNFEAYLQPNTGHAINLHYNATGANKVVMDFLDGKGLKPT